MPVSPPSGRAVLEGRAHELATLTQLVTDVAAGRGGALVIRGTAGIGKSALLEVARERALARQVVVVAVGGARAEMDLRLAGVEAVARALAAHVPRVDASHRSVLLTITAGGAPGVLAAVLAVRALLDSAARAEPVLVLVDDDQWLDAASLTTFAGVARRLAGTSAGLVLAGRPRSEPDVLRDCELTIVEPAALSDGAAQRVLAARRPPLTSEQRPWILARAAGNPLALRTLAAPETAVAAAPVGRPLPLPESLQRAFYAPVGELERACRAVLTLVAADPSATIAEVLAAASRVPGVPPVRGLELFEPAVRARLISVLGTQVRFLHPLTGTAIYRAASAETRRAAHAAFASCITDDADRRLWHRAAAVVGRDEEIALALADHAARAEDLPLKIAALARAAELEPSRVRGADRLVAAADLAFDAGNERLVRQLLDAAEHGSRGGSAWARAQRVAERFDDGLRRDSGAIVSTGTEPAAEALWALARRCQWIDPGAPVRDALAGALDRVESVPDGRRLATLALIAPERHREIADGVAILAAGPHSGRTWLSLGIAAMAYDDDLAFALISEAVSELQRAGADGLLAQARALRAHVGVATSRFAAADQDASRAVVLAERSGQPLWAARGRAAIALLAGLRGELELVEDHTALAERTAAAAHASAILSDVQLARGRAALADGRQEEAFIHLRRIFDGVDPAHHPLRALDAIADLAEAAMLTDRADEARDTIARFAGHVAELGRVRLRAGLAMAHALLAEDGDLPAAFAAAHAALPTGAGLERARLRLAHGRRLRRQRRILDSREQLRPAIETFAALGAPAWADRARQELRATGISARRRTPSTRGQLTAQELQIADLAGRGLSNREIGERLFLSPRTIGSHLYRIYPKLGIASRRELPAALASVPAFARP